MLYRRIRAREDITNGAKRLVDKLFFRKRGDWRVLVHEGEDWATWRMVDALSREEKARGLFARMCMEMRSDPPRRIQRGIYENRGEINSVVLVHGFDRVEKSTVLVGQGE